jgi:hypothetical protein
MLTAKITIRIAVFASGVYTFLATNNLLQASRKWTQYYFVGGNMSDKIVPASKVAPTLGTNWKTMSRLGMVLFRPYDNFITTNRARCSGMRLV